MERFDLIVIGSGPGGYVAAIRAAQLGMKVACIEKGPLGGTCLNIGCIPSKALLHSSAFFEEIQKEANHHGIEASGTLNFDQMMGRKDKIVSEFNQGIDALFSKNKITLIQGKGMLKGHDKVAVGSTTYQASYILLATGSEPISLPFLPIDEKQILSSTGALSLDHIPEKLLVIGAGVIGVELGSVYRRLGSSVTFCEFLPKICPTMDGQISSAFQKILEKQGLKFHLNTQVTGGKIENGKVLIDAKENETMHSFEVDTVLCSIGRRPYTKDLGLKEVGIETTPQGFIPINSSFQTNVPNIFAIGDIVDGPMLAHKASEEGVLVAEHLNSIHNTINYAAIPSVIYTDPEVASSGLTQEEAKEHKIPIQTGSFPLSINSRAKCTGQTQGLVKIIAHKETDQILGVHIIASNASELIAQGVFAIEKKMTALELGNMTYAHPTLSEAIKEAALAVHKRPIHK